VGLMLQSLTGLIAIPLIAWLLSEQRSALPVGLSLKIAAGGIALQFVIAGVFILIPQLGFVFDLLAGAVVALQTATGSGMQFLFGYLAGGATPFTVTDPGKGFVLALQALPIIMMMSVLARLLYHWGIMQKIVAFLAWLLNRSMGVSGPLGTVAAANVFVGMVDAPILVRPYLASVSRGGLFAMMTVGMATVAGSVMALYATFLQPVLAGAAGHILLASVMSAPAALVIARLMVPWDDDDGANGATEIDELFKSRSVMEAIATGTTDGVRLVVSVAAMLVVMVALVALVNMALSAATSPFGISITAEQIFGWVMTPLALLIGIPWSEAAHAGQLIGVKTVLNELIAYLQLAGAGETALSERSKLILTYALCGFANFGSLGIMTGGLLTLCPDRRADILSLGPRSLVSGTLATLMTGAVIGAITPP